MFCLHYRNNYFIVKKDNFDIFYIHYTVHAHLFYNILESFLYLQAIDQIRDNTVLYTNRAQTLIKLERYKEALIDCDWALRVN